MKRIYTLLLLITASLPIMAQQIFVDKSADIETIEFSKLDKITFSGTTVKISQTDGTATEASMGEISRIYFSNYSNIENTVADTDDIITYVSSDDIAVNCNAGDIIAIYNIIGKQLICVRQKSDNGIISIAHLPKGIYVIRTNDQTAKFVKR